jgi:hypothetical protein
VKVSCDCIELACLGCRLVLVIVCDSLIWFVVLSICLPLTGDLPFFLLLLLLSLSSPFTLPRTHTGSRCGAAVFVVEFFISLSLSPPGFTVGGSYIWVGVGVRVS